MTQEACNRAGFPQISSCVSGFILQERAVAYRQGNELLKQEEEDKKKEEKRRERNKRVSMVTVK